MFLFVVESAYEFLQAVQQNVQCLGFVCEYFDYEEK